MSGLARRTSGFLGDAAARGLLFCAASVALLAGSDVAFAGPCTEAIAALEQKVDAAPAGSGPTFSQTLGAQLHYQPTPRDVAHAQEVAREQVAAALEKARKADTKGDSEACFAAVNRARQLYEANR
jgi:Na+-translocating ferredoxin:NAD+ oxidoreductase RNF subunit RnfB